MSAKNQLVEQVKALQRGGDDVKQAWWDLCDQELGGIRDPKRHDEETLRQFIASCGGGAAKAPVQSWGGTSAYGASALADEIKQLQRSDPDAKQAWWDFADSELGGVRDPSRHDDQTLQQFLNQWNELVDDEGVWGSGKGKGKAVSKGKGRGKPAPAQTVTWVPVVVPAYGGKGGVMPPGEVVRMGQKKSDRWKAAWASWNRIKGSGKNDPSLYDEDYLVEFLDYLGQLAEQDLAGQEPVGNKRPGGGIPGEPPAKRMKGGGGGGNDQASLVARVKALQRADQSSKQAWWALCDGTYEGVRDPSRHDPTVLLDFLKNHESAVGSH